MIHFFIGLFLGLLAASIAFAITENHTLYLITGIAAPILYWLIVAVVKGKLRFDFVFDFSD